MKGSKGDKYEKGSQVPYFKFKFFYYFHKNIFKFNLGLFLLWKNFKSYDVAKIWNGKLNKVRLLNIINTIVFILKLIIFKTWNKINFLLIF
jgi:hypothetical protein